MSNIGLSMGPPNRKKPAAANPPPPPGNGGGGPTKPPTDPDMSPKAPKSPTPAKSGGGRGKVIGVAIGVIAVIVLLVGAAGFVFVKYVRTPAAPDFNGEGTGSVTVVVNQGDSVAAIGKELTDKGVVGSTQAFVDASKGNDQATKIQPGTYNVRQQMSAAAALTLLTDPAAKVVSKVTVKEGQRLDAVVANLVQVTNIPAADFEAALQDPQALGLPEHSNGNAEGFLFPATYEIPPAATAASILKQMVDKFNEVAADINLESRAKQEGITPYQAVTIASLLEAEGVPADFGKVSRVVENRISEGMPLQFDSTSNYASKASNIQLTDSQKDEDTPYNTYKNKGLPPTPIGQPGKAALEAALSPEPGDWLYFVTVDPGKKITKFTASYKEFLGYVDELNAYLRENPPSKSP